MDSVVSFRVLVTAVILFLCVNVRDVCSRSTGTVEDERVKRETSEVGAPLPFVDGRTHRASEPLDPNTAPAEGGADLFGGNFETRNTIFQPTLSEGGAEEEEEGEGPGAEEAAERGEASNREGDREYSAQFPYTSTQSSSTEAQVTGTDQEYVPGDLDRQEYVPGYVEAYREDTQSQGRTEGETQTGSRDGTYVQTRTVVRGGGDGGSASSSSGHVPETRDTSQGGYVPTQTRPSGTNPSGSERVTETRRVDVRGGSDSSDGVYPTGAGSYPIRTANSYPRSSGTSSGTYPSSSGTYPSSSGTYPSSSGTHSGSSRTYPSSSGTYPSSSGTYPSSSGTYPSSSGTYSGSAGTYPSSSNSNPTSGVDGYYVRSGQSYQTGTNTQGGTYHTGGGNSQSYPPITSAMSSDPNCPQDRPSSRVTINGLSCHSAIATLGALVCYNHERSSSDCCERCLAIKNPSHIGCEYGDRSYQCRNIQPFDCYAERNRQICCDRCRQFEEQHPLSISRGPNCRYGDLTPRCQSIQQRPHLCYLPENQRLCCVTCPRLARSEQTDCKWGDQNPDLCRPFDDQRRLRINCYVPQVKQVCCATCRSLRERMPQQIPGCEYGDNPVQFSTGRGVLDCREYVRLYGLDSCGNPQVQRNCCFTCQRYTSGRG